MILWSTTSKEQLISLKRPSERTPGSSAEADDLSIPGQNVVVWKENSLVWNEWINCKMLVLSCTSFDAVYPAKAGHDSGDDNGNNFVKHKTQILKIWVLKIQYI